MTGNGKELKTLTKINMSIINLGASIPEVKTVPSKEKVLTPSSNPRKGEFTPTSLETYLDCPRKYYLGKVMGLSPTKFVGSQVFGSAIHAGVGKFYELKDTQLPFEELKLACVREFAQNWNPEYNDSKRNTDTGLAIISGYCSRYKNDTAKYLADMIETNITISMPNETKLFMRLDRILVEENFFTVVDTKTSSMALTDYFLKGFIMSFQLSTYVYAVAQIKGHCDNVQVDLIKVPPDTDMEKGFVRKSMDRTELQMADWLNTYEEITDRIQESFTENNSTSDIELRCFHQNQNSCTKYGGCPYFSICQFGLSHPDVKIMFTRKNQVESEE